MSNVRINALTATAVTPNYDDYFVIDGNTYGTRNILATTALSSITGYGPMTFNGNVTVYANISGNEIFDSAGNSVQWNAAYTYANSTSSLNTSDFTAIATTSANWNLAYNDVQAITPVSGNWNQSYTYFTWLTANSGNNTGGTAWQANSALVLGDLSNIASTSANWNLAYSDVQAITPVSGNWNQAYTYTNSKSSLEVLSGSNAYLNTLTASNVNFLNNVYFNDVNAYILRDNSLDLLIQGPYQISLKPNGIYQWTFSNDGGLTAPDGMVFAGSSNGVQFVDGSLQKTAYPASTIAPLTSNWNQSYTYFTWLTANSGNNTGGTAWQANSALVLGDLTNIASTSANWNLAYNDIQAITPVSGNWNQAYTTFNANSASYATTTYVASNFLALTGGTVNGNTTFAQNVVIQGTLSALSASYFQTSIFTSSSALSVIDIGGGPALYVKELGAAGDVASFYDYYGEVLHVGNRAGSLYNGLVGINNGAPNKALTVVGDISSTATLYGSALEIGILAPNAILPNLVGQFTSNANTYQQVNNTNLYPGSAASSDFVATADNGTDTTNFVDLGINNSLFSDPAFTVAQADDAYLYNNGGNFAIGTSSNNAIKFFTNGTLSSNVVMYVAPGGNVGIGQAITNPGATLTVSGTLSTNNVINDVTSTSTQWKAGYTFANSYSGYLIGDETSVANTSANWNLAYSDIQAITPVSATWNTAYTYTINNSAQLATIQATSANWNLAYNDVQAITPVSGNWNQAYTYTNTNSAYELGAISNVVATSGNWNQAYTWSNSNSANLTTSTSNYLALSGGTLTGALTSKSSIGSTSGFYNTSAFGGPYSDGIVMDYVTGNGRISVGIADNLSFYNGGPATTALVTVSSNGSMGVNTTPANGQTLTVGGSATFFGGVSASVFWVNGAPLSAVTGGGNSSQSLIAGYSIVFGR